MYFDIDTGTIVPLNLNKDVTLYNLSGSILINDDRLAICGGVSFHQITISNSFYLYHITQNRMIKMPNMINKRFNFSLIFFENNLFALGGR